jgi:hypothetical protein
MCLGITGFQPIGTLEVSKQRGFKAMFWTHWEPKSRYVWSVWETGCVSPHGEGFLWRDCCVYIRGSGANFLKYWLYWLKGQCMVKIVYICAFKNCICADSFWTSFIFIFCILCIFWDGKNFLRFFNKQPFLAFGIDFWNYFEKWQFLDKTGRCANHGLEYGLACILEANCCA